MGNKKRNKSEIKWEINRGGNREINGDIKREKIGKGIREIKKEK